MSESPKAMLAPFFFLGGGSEMQICSLIHTDLELTPDWEST